MTVVIEQPKTKHTAVSYKASDIKQETLKGVLKAVAFALDKNYRLEVNGVETKIDIAGVASTFSRNIEADIMLVSKKTKKGLLKRLRALNGTITIRKVNKLLHFLRTKVIADQTLVSYKFVYSERESEIISARQTYVTLRDATAKALAIYKAAKGDFYKTQLSK